ncbi:hypothetical protein BP00DRAFT_215302 [Aspergillus indologenus CBS 114.80]|uniref:Uncharacterized protein n=1 Tax=Aspergillus indologenus CBS 114.80 TaxID=1450541 RepID=A0A2V5J065_9EURO|nr:hypothetical protein BP00DRAFT_215302 [Aspergillus indologenus CBS 114.80]
MGAYLRRRTCVVSDWTSYSRTGKIYYWCWVGIIGAIIADSRASGCVRAPVHLLLSVAILGSLHFQCWCPRYTAIIGALGNRYGP